MGASSTRHSNAEWALHMIIAMHVVAELKLPCLKWHGDTAFHQTAARSTPRHRYHIWNLYGSSPCYPVPWQKTHAKRSKTAYSCCAETRDWLPTYPGCARRWV
jgi:hypothetical protein